MILLNCIVDSRSVSYTHLDVYKRQPNIPIYLPPIQLCAFANQYKCKVVMYANIDSGGRQIYKKENCNLHQYSMYINICVVPRPPKRRSQTFTINFFHLLKSGTHVFSNKQIVRYFSTSGTVSFNTIQLETRVHISRLIIISVVSKTRTTTPSLSAKR